MNTTEGLAPLCRVLRISPCRVAMGLCFTENVKAGRDDFAGWAKLGMVAVRADPFCQSVNVYLIR